VNNCKFCVYSGVCPADRYLKANDCFIPARPLRKKQREALKNGPVAYKTVTDEYILKYKAKSVYWRKHAYNLEQLEFYINLHRGEE